MGRKRSASKKAKISTETLDRTMAPQEGLETSNVFSHDMDTLECEICSLPFDSQIFMCKNGHAACANCCIGMNGKCGNCHERIGDFRCRAMEKVLAGMARPCRFSRHGCEETVKFTELRSHEEEACPYAPYSCPFDGCAYRGALLHDHVRDEHETAPVPAHNCDIGGGVLPGASVTLRRDDPVHALPHHDRVSVLLLLNGGDVLTGRSLSLVRICPHPKPGQEDEEYEYRMVVMRGEPGPGSPSLAASGKVQYVRRLEGYQPQHFLFVPDAFWGSSGSVVVTVTTTVTVHLI